MNINIKVVSETLFRNTKAPILFKDSLSRVHGLITINNYTYKIGWQSEKIEPIVNRLDEDLYSVGIDSIFLIFNVTSGYILLNISLDYYYYDTIILDQYLYAITQLEIIKIEISTLTVIKIYPLPDYFESIHIKMGIPIVKCIDNSIVILE